MINVYTKSLLLITLGILLTLTCQNKIRKFWRGFLSKAPLIKNYWKLVIPFSIGTILTYFIIFKYVPIDKQSVYITMAGQVLPLIFAIFVGYFAFLQVVENRFGKLGEQGFGYFSNKLYLRARQCYEEAHAIHPRDFNALANLLEIYLIIHDYEKFDQKIPLLKELIVESTDKMSYCYLKCTRFLLNESLKEGKKEIAECVMDLKQHPYLTRPFWRFDEIKGSEVYKNLKGDARTILDNFIKYLSFTFNEEQKKAFENGDYLIK